MVRFVGDIFLSGVLISEVFGSLFVLYVLLCVYGLVLMLNLNTIHSRRSVMHQMLYLFLSCVFSVHPLKAFPAWMLPPNELMVDPPDYPSVTMAKMEASILDLLMVSSKIVASRLTFHVFLVPLFSVGATPVLGRRDVAISISCIASSVDIFPVRFDRITEPFFLRLCSMKYQPVTIINSLIWGSS